MKYPFFFLLLLIGSENVFSQSDSLWVSFPGDGFNLPITAEKSVVYQRIYEFDTKIKSSEIFSGIKPSLADFYNKASIGLNDKNAIFKSYSDNPIIYEDKESNKITLQLSFRSVKNDDEPDNVKQDQIIFCKADFIVRDNRLKMVIKDINFYFQSTGIALLVGKENSLLTLSLDNLKSKLNESGFYSTTDYLGKRIFTVDYKLRKLLNEVQIRLKNYIEASRF